MVKARRPAPSSGTGGAAARAAAPARASTTISRPIGNLRQLRRDPVWKGCLFLAFNQLVTSVLPAAADGGDDRDLGPVGHGGGEASPLADALRAHEDVDVR